MRHLVALPVVAGLALLGGCTSDQEASALATINGACTALGVGAQIAVNVVGAGAASKQISTITGDVNSSCQLVVAGTQTIIEQLTGAGQTTAVTVAVQPAAKAASAGASVEPVAYRAPRPRVARFAVTRDASGELSYAFPPTLAADLGVR